MCDHKLSLSSMMTTRYLYSGVVSSGILLILMFILCLYSLALTLIFQPVIKALHFARFNDSLFRLQWLLITNDSKGAVIIFNKCLSYASSRMQLVLMLLCLCNQALHNLWLTLKANHTIIVVDTWSHMQAMKNILHCQHGSITLKLHYAIYFLIKDIVQFLADQLPCIFQMPQWQIKGCCL